MAENNENFRNDLEKMAEVVDIIENTFIGKNKVELITTVDEKNFDTMVDFLEYDKKSNKCVVNIGGVNFIFLKM